MSPRPARPGLVQSWLPSPHCPRGAGGVAGEEPKQAAHDGTFGLQGGADAVRALWFSGMMGYSTRRVGLYLWRASPDRRFTIIRPAAGAAGSALGSVRHLSRGEATPNLNRRLAVFFAGGLDQRGRAAVGSRLRGSIIVISSIECSPARRPDRVVPTSTPVRLRSGWRVVRRPDADLPARQTGFGPGSQVNLENGKLSGS
jgi:hypothetical protein